MIMIMKNGENNGREEIGLEPPTPWVSQDEFVIFPKLNKKSMFHWIVHWAEGINPWGDSH